MKKAEMYRHQESGLVIFCNEYNEAHSRMDGSDDYYSVPVREWVCRCKSGEWLFSFRSQNAQAKGNTKRALKAQELELAKKKLFRFYYWIGELERQSKFAPQFKCDNLDSAGRKCHYMHLADDNTARCYLRPNSYGYAGGGSPNEMRHIPADKVCDLGAYVGKMLHSLNDGDIFSLRDYWLVKSGEAKHMIDAPAKSDLIAEIGVE